MKSLGERLLELRERYVASGKPRVADVRHREDEWSAVLQVVVADCSPLPLLDMRLYRTVAIERAAVRELRKEGKL